MKKIALAAAFSMAATSAFAGGHIASKYAEPVIEPAIIVEDTSASSGGGLIVPLMLLVLVAAVAATHK